MLLAEKIRYRYQPHVPLMEDTDCTIKPGEIVGLPGQSGCGKTTLGLLFAGYLTPQAGSVRCDGSLLPKNGYCPVQMIFQHPELAVNPRWKIGKILEEGNGNYGTALQQFGIHPSWLERYPHELSGGELQRITLLRVMNPATRYLIADEMTASLDPNTQALIWQAVLSWVKSENIGVLAISHDHKLLERISDRIDYTFSSAEQYAA